MRHEEHYPKRDRDGDSFVLPAMVIVESLPMVTTAAGRHYPAGVFVVAQTEAHEGAKSQVRLLLSPTEARDLAGVLIMESYR